MTDLDPTTQTPEGTPAATPPVPTPPAIDVDAIKAELTATFTSQMDERVKGFQKLLNERDERIRQLQAASMSEEEQEQLALQEQEDRVAALEAENWLLQKAQTNAKAAELFKKVLEADPDEQFAVFAELASRLESSPAPEAPEPEAQVPDIDPNNPRVENIGADAIMVNGQRITTELADQILRSMDRWPNS